jgi:hypothetical protein
LIVTIILIVVMVALVGSIAVTQWVDLVRWTRRKGWREPSERIEQGPRTALDDEPDQRLN